MYDQMVACTLGGNKNLSSFLLRKKASTKQLTDRTTAKVCD